MRKRHQKAYGDQAEAIFEAYAQGARNQKVAFLDKIATPSKNVDGKIVYEEKSTVDYIGAMLDGAARIVAIEVKSCRGTAFPFKEVKPHQAAFLDNVAKAGGVAALAIVSPEFSGVEVFCVPWSVVRAAMKIGDRKSLPRDAWQPYRVSPLTLLSSWKRLPSSPSSPPQRR